MIITCNKCSTRFNLDDSLVKEEGSKVRCSVCKEIFTAYPASPEPEQEAYVTSDPGFESDTDDGDIFEEPSDFEMEDSEFSLEEDTPAEESSGLEMADSGLEMEEPDLDMEEPSLEVDDDFSFEESELEIDEGDEAESLETETEESPFDFEEENFDFEDTELEDTGDVDEDDLDEIEFEAIEDDEVVPLAMEDEPEPQDSGAREADKDLDSDSLDDEDEFELEFDVDDDSEDDIPEIDTDIPDDIPLEMETDTENDDLELSHEENSLTQGDEPPVIPLEEDFSAYDEVLEQETEPETESLEDDTIEIEDVEQKEDELIQTQAPGLEDVAPRSRRRKKKPLVGTPVLVLLLIFLLVIGAYIASIMTGYKIPYLSDVKIPFIEQYIKKPAPETSNAKPVPNQKSVNGRFVTNSSAGALFVITGRVENPSKTTYSHIEIRGALITKGKQEAKTKSAFCGNIIPEEILKTGNISDINKLLLVKAGAHNANINIKPGASVPFMVVFSDLPDKLQNFTVKVLNFEKAKK